MGQSEIFEGMSDDDMDIEIPLPEKKKKPKRVLSEDRKAQLREQLKKGRETSLANRKKKALVRSAEKEIKKKEDDKKIAKAFLEKDSEADELAKLRAEMKAMKEAMAKPKKEEAPAPPKEVKKEEPAPAPAPAPQRRVFNTRGQRLRKYF